MELKDRKSTGKRLCDDGFLSSPYFSICFWNRVGRSYYLWLRALHRFGVSVSLCASEFLSIFIARSFSAILLSIWLLLYFYSLFSLAQRVEGSCPSNELAH